MKKVLLFIAGLLCVLVQVAAFLFEDKYHFTTVAPTPIPGRVETYSDLRLSRQWSYSFGSGCYIGRPTCLYLDNGRVILIFNDLMNTASGYWDQQHAQLVSLSLEDGSVVWQLPIEVENWGTTPDDGFTDIGARRWYLAFGYRIHAFNLDTGQIIWSTEELPSHNGYYFDTAWQNPIVVYSTTDIRYEIDSETGTILSKQKQEMPPLIHEDWRRNHFEDIQISAEGWILNLITAQNLNGEEIWRGGDLFVTNAAVIGEHVYAVDVQGDMVAIHARTGQRLGRMKFSEPIREIRPEGEHGWREGYFVFAQGEYLLIVSSDKRELLVYKEQ